MYGSGILKGLGVTMKHFVESYKDDRRWASKGGRYYNDEALQSRQSTDATGVATVFYPEEKLSVPERFRFVPFLVTDDPEPGEQWGKNWCTACGTCAKVCPPQCIWIEKAVKPNGRPDTRPEKFFIDIDICMNCGLCAEFCPFDAIKMDHDYELASYSRTTAHIHDIERLSKPISYWREIAPKRAEAEATAREFAINKKKNRRKKKEEGAKEDRIAEAIVRQLVYQGVQY